MQVVSVLGLGWLGDACAEFLQSKNLAVKGSKQYLNDSKNYPVYNWKLGQELPIELFAPIMIISIASKYAELSDYKKLFLELKNAEVQKVIFISSTGVYDGQTAELLESSTLIKTNKNKQLIEIEELILEILPQTIIFRCAGLIGPNRNPAKFLSGKMNVSNPNQLVNLVHREDVLAAIEQAILLDVSGVFNICSSSHPSRKEFYEKCCDIMKMERPNFSNSEENVKWVSNSKSKMDLKLKYKFDDLEKDYLSSLIKE